MIGVARGKVVSQPRVTRGIEPRLNATCTWVMGHMSHTTTFSVSIPEGTSKSKLRDLVEIEMAHALARLVEASEKAKP